MAKRSGFSDAVGSVSLPLLADLGRRHLPLLTC